MALSSRLALDSASEPAPPLINLPDVITHRYDTVVEHIQCGPRMLSLLRVRDSNRLLDAITPEDFAVDERLPFWADLWPASIALAREVCLQRSLAGKRVLELGCGLGLAGIAAAGAGARVTFSDYEPDALLFTRFNVYTNLGEAGSASADIRLLDWRDTSLAGQYDVILGADILYERRVFTALAVLFRRMLQTGGYVLLSDPNRSTGKEFFASAKAQGFNVEERSADLVHHGKHHAITIAMVRLTPQ